MVDQRTAPVCHLQHSSILDECQLQRDLLPAHALKVCDAVVVDSPVLQCSISQHYLDVKHNETYV